MRALKVIVRIISLIGLVTAGAGLFFFSERSDVLDVVNYEYSTAKLKSTESLKIAQLTDFHNHSLTYQNGTDLLATISAENPDVILCTGDFVDSHTEAEDLSRLETMFTYFSKHHFPVYYVSGNHEKSATAIASRAELIYASCGAISLADQKVSLTDDITLSGLDDIGGSENLTLFEEKQYGNAREQLTSLQNSDSINQAKFNIILAHRPNLFDLTSEFGYDMQFSGHTHGGQIMVNGVPLIHSPFYSYLAGQYEKATSTLFVSRGLGVSYNLPFRFGCNPELLCVTIKGTA